MNSGQQDTERCSLQLLTSADSIVELGRHIKVLVARGIVFSMEGAVVGDNVGDVAILARAKLVIAIAPDTAARRGAC